jgi:hypothetical protein
MLWTAPRHVSAIDVGAVEAPTNSGSSVSPSPRKMRPDARQFAPPHCSSRAWGVARNQPLLSCSAPADSVGGLFNFCTGYKFQADVRLRPKAGRAGLSLPSPLSGVKRTPTSRRAVAANEPKPDSPRRLRPAQSPSRDSRGNGTLVRPAQ